MTQRHEWTFAYSIEELRQAAQAQLGRNQDRVSYWVQKKEEAEINLRENGVEFRDDQVTGGSQLNIMVDPDLRQRYDDARSKLRTYVNLVEEFERWLRVFHGLDLDVSSEVDETRELDVRDIEYFGL